MDTETGLFMLVPLPTMSCFLLLLPWVLIGVMYLVLFLTFWNVCEIAYTVCQLLHH